MLRNRIKRKIFTLNAKFAFKTGFHKLLVNPVNTDFIILLYHGVDLYGSTKFNTRFCKQSCFKQQVQFIKRNFEVVDFRSLFDPVKCNSNRPKIAITFDDGYKNNFKYALPILERYQVPATFFVTSFLDQNNDILWTDYIDIASQLTNKTIETDEFVFEKRNNKYIDSRTGKKMMECLSSASNYSTKKKVMDSFSAHITGFKKDEKLLDYWQLMSPEEIKTVSQSQYVTIGSHSQMHNDLGQIPIDEAQCELSHSKQYLEDVTQKNIDSIAYPNGSYSRQVIDTAEKIGYKYQLAVKYLHEEDEADHRILDRKGGIYSTGPCYLQMCHALLH